ncbi:MAG: thiamine-phosphate kinase [Myxococcota bacterium]|nr:thiamine-phosphate kinase [Myxococcota bacterium]
MGGDPDESFVISTILDSSTTAAVRDDASPWGPDQVVSVDAMVEGVHFDERLSPGDVGWKLVAVNASDIGAMGAVPRWALLCISLPEPLDRAWVTDFSRGLHEALSHWRIQLLGGDTTRSPAAIHASLSIGGSLFAQGARSLPVTRAGARPGDLVWVTGSLGVAAAGFFHDDPVGLKWLNHPDPPVHFGRALGVQGIASAMMDLSDGLAEDLPRLCEASGVAARIDPQSLPLATGLVEKDNPLELAMGFGDDYQLLFTAAAGDRERLESLASEQQVSIHAIGNIVEGKGAELIGHPWPPPVFSHFEARS